MSSGQTADRVYEALKQRIRDRGFRPGERLDPTRLSADLMSSVTPVRDALNRLTGESLVETRTSDGFHLPRIDATALQDLYDWSIETLSLAIRSWPAGLPSPMHELPVPGMASSEAIFATIGRLSANAEHYRAILNLNDRIHAARLCESAILGADDSETTAMLDAITANQRSDLRTLLTAYHRRRRRIADDIVRALYRAPTIDE